MLIHSHACTGERSNIQQGAFAQLSHSAATYVLRDAQCPFLNFFNFCHHVFVMNRMGYAHFDEQVNKHGCVWMPLQQKQTIKFLPQEK